MSKFIISKYSELPISSTSVLYHHNVISGDQINSIGSINPLPSTDKNNHLFLKISIGTFKNEKNILSTKYRLLILSDTQFNNDVEFSLIYEDPFDINISTSQAHQRVNQSNQYLIGKSHVNYFNESNTGYIEFELTNHVISKLKTSDNHIHMRISNNSSEKFYLINPDIVHSDLSAYGGELNTSSHFDGLVVTVSDPIKDTREVLGINEGGNCLIDYVSGDFLHMLPEIGNTSHALSNTINQNKSNLLSSLFYTIKTNITQSILVDYLGNENVYRTLHPNDLKGLYGIEVDPSVYLADFNIKDFSYAVNMANDNNVVIKFPNGFSLKLFHAGQIDMFGHKIFRLEWIKNKNIPIIEVDWSHTNQAIIHKEDEVTIISFFDTKIDSIEIPKWHRKYQMVYEQIQNKYYLKEIRHYNQDELGDVLVDKQTITYDGNKYLSTVNLADYLVLYTYTNNKLTRIQMGSLEEENNSYDFEYYPLDKYTKISNEQGKSNQVYYSQLGQKTLVTDGENHRIFESYKASNGDETLTRKEIIDLNKNDIEKSEYQLIQGNLIDGWEGFGENQLSDFLVNNTFFPDIIGHTVVNFKGRQNEVREFKTKVFPSDRQIGDEWFFSAWVKADMIDLDTAQLKITIHNASGSEEVKYFDFDKKIKDWQIITGYFKCENRYQSITCAFSYKGKNNLKLGKVKLYKQKINELYEFNERNQIEKINVDGEFVEYVYDKEKIIKAITASGRVFDYTYDDNSNILSIRDLTTQFKVESTYEDNLLIKETTTSDEGFVSTSSYEYDEKGLVIKTIDGDGFTQNFLYDKYGRLIQTQDASGIVHQKKYNMKNQITNYRYQLNENNDGGIFEYGVNGNLYKLNTKNEMHYEFDSSLNGNRLNEVSIGGITLESRNYGTGNLKNTLLSNQYGSSNNQFKYEYNEKGQIIKKKYNENDLVNISYADDQLIIVTDVPNNQSKELCFDDSQKIIKEINKVNGVEKGVFSYAYDDKDSIIKKAFSSENQTISYDYNHSYDFKKNNLNSYLEKISIQYLNDYLRVNNSHKTIYSDNNLLALSAIEYISDINQNVMRLNDKSSCIVMDANQINKNRVDQTKYSDLTFSKNDWISGFVNNKIIYGWIRVSGENLEDKEILRMGQLALYLDTNLRVKLKHNSNEMLTQIVVNKDVWFMISLRLTQTEAIVTVNNHDERFAVNYKSSQADFISIGNYPASNPTQIYLDNKYFELSDLVIDVLYMGYGTSNVTTNCLRLMYFEGERYLNQPQNILATQTSYFNASLYEGSEVFSLNGSTLSSKGRKPSKYQYSNPNQNGYKLKQFKYDDDLLRYVYTSFSKENNEGPELVYTLDLKQQGTMNVFIKPEETTLTTTRTILSLISPENNVVFNLFMDYTSRLRFSLLGTTYGTTYIVNPGEWHMVTFVWQQNQIKIYVNHQLVHQQTVNAFDFSNTALYIGSRGGADYPFRHLEGYIEMFSVWDITLTTEHLEKLYTEGLPIMFESKVDSKGRPVENIIYSLENTFTKTYGYHDEIYTENNENKIKLGKVPVSETSSVGTKVNYKYDEYFNVVEKEYLDISNKAIKVVYYVYDGLKRLSKEIVNHVTIDMTNPNEPIRNETCDYAYEYLYDQNGNILKKTQINGIAVTYEDTYIYDETIKDRLNRITRRKNNQTTTYYELTYDPNNQFWPSQIFKDNTNHQLLWQGPQLMSLGHYQYQYNENGIRVKKTGGGVNIKYDVDGTQVIRSTDLNNNKTMLYHFDQNGQLIGLNYSGKDYVYQRNILGEIYGIMDLNGKQIIQYSYNAYGVPSITFGTYLNSSETTIASDIAEFNIYLYKGYIYDQETNLYYCQTRYYDPEVGRWLSIDHIAYLDSESIGGLNLYAYCGNNPVMYSDPSGNFPILAILSLVTIVGMVLTVGGVVTKNNTVTAIGLTMIAIPALITGGLALVSGIATGATLTGVIGGGTLLAGLGTGAFATAEFQEASGNGNWIIDSTGMSEGLYNGLMLSIAAIATMGTIASSISYSFNIKSISKFGKYGDYYGMKFQTGAGKTHVLSFHTHGHKVAKGIKSIPEWHWQLQKWNPYVGKTSGTIARWIWWSLAR